MRGAIPPLPQYAFMAWCSVKEKAQGQLYFYLSPFTFTTTAQCILRDALQTQSVVANIRGQSRRGDSPDWEYEGGLILSPIETSIL
jgi:hypothetical protein